MARTTQDLATRALKLLGILEAQEEAAAEDYADIARAYENKHAELTLRNVVYWPLNEIPNEAFEHMSRVVADEIASTFGKSAPTEMDENGNVVAMGVKGLSGLRRLTQRPSTDEPTQALYF